MKQMIIHLNQSRTFGLFDGAKGTETIAQFKAGRFLKLPPIPVGELNGEDVAEEAFDLTNNPSRDEERQARYGNGRSVSSGDVIEVEGRFFLCMSIGWKEFN